MQPPLHQYYQFEVHSRSKISNAHEVNRVAEIQHDKNNLLSNWVKWGHKYFVQKDMPAIIEHSCCGDRITAQKFAPVCPFQIFNCVLPCFKILYKRFVHLISADENEQNHVGMPSGWTQATKSCCAPCQNWGTANRPKEPVPIIKL